MTSLKPTLPDQVLTDERGCWVQDYGCLDILEAGRADRPWLCKAPDGREIRLDHATLAARYQPGSGPARLKRKYQPLYAVVVAEPMEIEAGETTLRLNPGDALGRDAEGRLEAIPAAAFARDYLPVDLPGNRGAPAYPFPGAPIWPYW